MDKKQIVDKVQDLVRIGDVDQAKAFVNEHKDELGDYFDRTKDLLGGNTTSTINDMKSIFRKDEK